jgi:diguanylate cyclase (GGDEF)-like protein
MTKVRSLILTAACFVCLEVVAVLSARHVFSMPLAYGLIASLAIAHVCLVLFLVSVLRRRSLPGGDEAVKNDGAPVIDLLHENASIDQLQGELKDVTKKLQKQMYDLHNLFEVSIHLNSILEPQRLIESSMLSLMGQMQTNQTIIFLPSKNNGSAVFPFYSKGFSGFTDKDIEKYKISLKDPVIGKFGEKMIALDLLGLDKDLLVQPWSLLIGSGISMIAPIIVKNQIRGLIAVGHKMNNELFTKPEQELFSLLAHFISVAFYNAILYQRMEQISVTDGLTGLYNYRYFKRRLEDEFLRSSRYHHSLSLVLFDVDHFKNFNDTMGHPAGDVVLKTVAQILQSTIRKTDIAVRYGGEEFCVILPETDMNSAYIFAERFRKQIDAHHFEGEEVQPGKSLTISVGMASFPQDADSPASLLEKADNALYEAKSSGRNRTCSATPITC